MKIALSTFGSEGDVRPFIALGAALRKRGHEAYLVAAEPFRERAAGAGVPFRANGMSWDVARLEEDRSCAERDPTAAGAAVHSADHRPGDRRGAGAMVALSPTLVPPDPAWEGRYHVTGHWFLEEPAFQPPAELERFAAAGPPPVFTGFGSMPDDHLGLAGARHGADRPHGGPTDVGGAAAAAGAVARRSHVPQADRPVIGACDGLGNAVRLVERTFDSSNGRTYAHS